MPSAIIVGAGPNGLAAAIELARAGWSVRVYEAKDTIGGGARSAELTLPGFVHDICSAIHPLGAGSPFLSQLPLGDYGLEWIQPDIPLAHPLGDDRAVALYPSIDETAAQLGVDSRTYCWLMEPLADHWPQLSTDILGPLLRIPRHPFLMARFGITAVAPAKLLARTLFRTPQARALLAGNAAHSQLPLEMPLSASFGLVLMLLGHVIGWPLPRGGSQSLMNAMAAYLQSLGGEIITSRPVENVDDLPAADAVLLDITPRQLLQLAGHRLPDGYKRWLENYRYGMGIFKLDYALAGPIPWRAEACRRAGTVHVGGPLDDVAVSESAAWHGGISDRPFLIVAQQSLFDDSRAPAGQHTCWAYCHTPLGSTEDYSERIEQQIERYAPGFRDLILARHTMHSSDYERYNPNYIGGDINGGAQDALQLFFRPTPSLVPYATPAKGLYLCSSSTPPGGGVHGLCGYHAAQAVLRQSARSN
ncbi:MAG: FAD-dependent oxidoreductase [Anaerolineaceae bacterium]|nr:FAD-dependent oxidoreductase [Anaerolineaceae bacterium]